MKLHQLIHFHMNTQKKRKNSSIIRFLQKTEFWVAPFREILLASSRLLGD